MLDAAPAVEKPFEIEVCQSEEQINKADLIILKGGFSTSDHSYKFEIKSDGTGEIFYSDFDGEDAEEFAHEIKVEELAADIEKAIREQIDLQRGEDRLEVGEIEAIRKEISGEMLDEVFWEQINPTLEDPFFRSVYDDGDWSEEFQTTRGTVDELLEFLKLCVLTEREISSPEDFLVVEAETEIDCAELSDCSYYTERLSDLVEIACEYYKPSGFRYDYNDGCYDRQSGYCLTSESISVSLAEAARAPTREKMHRNDSAERKARSNGNRGRKDKAADGFLIRPKFFMNETIACKLSPVKILAVSAAPLRELLNFLIYGKHAELLTERARQPPLLSWEKHPLTIKELGTALGAESRDKNGKLFFNCEKTENHVAVLLDNHGAQFWIHYFRCGVGLVSLSFFSHLASAEGSLTNHTRSVMHSNEYQWFTHELSPEFFGGCVDEITIKRLGDYFIEEVNSTLVYPYSIYLESPKIKEPYKFVSGSLERLTEVLIWTRFVCEGLKREREPNGRNWISQHATINCGNLRDAPSFEHSTESFINAVGALAVKENAPYTVLREGYGRRAGDECYDWVRKNKHRIFLNLEQKCKDVPIRLRIAARAHLTAWLREQGLEGNQVLKTWRLFD